MDSSDFLVFEKNIDVKKAVEKANDQLPPIKTLAPVAPSNQDMELQSLPTLVDSSSESEDNLCQTPVDCKFDSFAPGPEELCNAPRAMKLEGKSRIPVMRHLSFQDDESSEDEVKADPSDDDMLLAAAYNGILEGIISSQENGLFGSDDVYKTSDSAKRPTGIAETCHGAPAPAPVIGSRKPRKPVHIYKKLEF